MSLKCLAVVTRQLVRKTKALDLTLHFKQEEEWGPIHQNCPPGVIRHRFGLHDVIFIFFFFWFSPGVVF